MGFTKEKAIHALKLNNNNFNNALDYLFNHPDEIIDETNDNKKEEKNEEIKEINVGNGSIYDLYGYITHLGKSADHGHYVAHIRQKTIIGNTLMIQNVTLGIILQQVEDTFISLRIKIINLLFKYLN